MLASPAAVVDTGAHRLPAEMLRVQGEILLLGEAREAKENLTVSTKFI